eukprot:UN06658
MRTLSSPPTLQNLHEQNNSSQDHDTGTKVQQGRDSKLFDSFPSYQSSSSFPFSSSISNSKLVNNNSSNSNMNNSNKNVNGSVNSNQTMDWNINKNKFMNRTLFKDSNSSSYLDIHNSDSWKSTSKVSEEGLFAKPKTQFIRVKRKRTAHQAELLAVSAPKKQRTEDLFSNLSLTPGVKKRETEKKVFRFNQICPEQKLK